jgi:hypothetical protein
MSFDPRSIGTPVYEALSLLKNQTRQDATLKEQKSQAVELYTYLSTWGMLRLKAEEQALSQDGKKQIVNKFFQCLETISTKSNLTGNQGLETLKNLPVSEYLGLTGLGLAIAQEFSFWTTAIYVGIDEGDI